MIIAKRQGLFLMGRYFITAIVLGVIVFVGVQNSYGETVARLTGNDYQKLPVGFRTTYIIGILDGISAANDLLGKPNPHLSNFLEYTKGMTGGQLVAIVDKFLAEHPEGWHYTMGSSVVMAIIETRKSPEMKK